MFAVSSVLKNIIGHGRRNFLGWMTKAFSHDLTRIREEFRQYAGGSVNFKLNEKTGIAEICLNNPEKKNALSGSMMVDLADAVTSLEQWTEGKGVILYGQGNIFCSGGDLDMMQKIFTPEQGLQMSMLMHDILNRFQSLPLISVSLVHGNAIGGGAEVAIASDFRLATPGSYFHFVQKKLGIVPGFGGGTRLVRLLGPTKALEILGSSRKIFGDEALSLGLITAILNPEPDPLSQAHEWLSSLTSGPHKVVRALKGVVHAASRGYCSDSLLEERRLFSTVWGGHAQKKALEKVLKTK